MAGIGRNDCGQTLDEDLTPAGGIVAEEASHPQLERHGDALPGQVGDPTQVVRMDPRRSLVAQRALGLRSGGRHVGNDPLGLYGESEQVQMGRVRHKTRGRWSPWQRAVQHGAPPCVGTLGEEDTPAHTHSARWLTERPEEQKCGEPPILDGYLNRDHAHRRLPRLYIVHHINTQPVTHSANAGINVTMPT
jgi:hypothetical protein